ncbi:sensor histidine kinase [bacterium D16-51]|nr:sensor histidine kinase [bacterium D16-59]RKI60446.1 sensor histidine kinase [bacterium D16-51]
MFSGLDINGVTEMRNDGVQIKITIITAFAVWLLSLAVFAIMSLRVGMAAFSIIFIYGLWNLIIFFAAYLAVSRKISNVMQRVDNCIQSMIDGCPVRQFSEMEDSLLGKFQYQLIKLYQILNCSQEREKKLRKEMGSLVADLVHQINTPLTNIQIYSGFLMQEGLVKEEKEKVYEIINHQIEKLGWLGDGFHKAAQLEDDIRKLEPKRQPVLPAVLSAIDEISVKAEAHGDEIVFSGEQDAEAFYDSKWTEEAVFNLLDNAVKYGEEGSSILVQITSYELFVRVDVINYGTPIPKEEYPAIFNRYYRGKNAACVKEGVGLGLYLSRQVAAGQGGYIKVGNYQGKGNIFSIFLMKNSRD